jgi:hypothetical protein
MLPTEFSDGARRAHEAANVIARGPAAELILLHVSVETSLYNEGMRGLVEPRAEILSC